MHVNKPTTVVRRGNPPPDNLSDEAEPVKFDCDAPAVREAAATERALDPPVDTADT